MPGENWSHENTVECRQQFLRKRRRIPVIANVFLLPMTPYYQLIAKDDIDVFREYRTVKWIYKTLDAPYIVAHLIVSMELSSRSTFRRVRMVFGTLGFAISYNAWLFINM